MGAATVLLISRGTMSGGQMIGECLAKHEGIRYLTRENLLATVNNYGEIATRVTAQIANAVGAYAEFTELRRPYRILMKRALLESAREGRLAYFGYSGHLLMDRVAHFVRIRLIAPLEVRVIRARQQLRCSDAEAREYIRRVDHERTHWAYLMYGLDIRAPELYDVCLNIERVSMEGACELLRSLMQQKDFQPTPESTRQVENERIASEALATLVTDARTLQMEFGATVEDGVLRLTGPYLSEDETRIVSSVAGSVAGVRSVEFQPGYAPVFQYSH